MSSLDEHCTKIIQSRSFTDRVDTYLRNVRKVSDTKIRICSNGALQEHAAMLFRRHLGEYFPNIRMESYPNVDVLCEKVFRQYRNLKTDLLDKSKLKPSSSLDCQCGSETPPIIRQQTKGSFISLPALLITPPSPPTSEAPSRLASISPSSIMHLEPEDQHRKGQRGKFWWGLSNEKKILKRRRRKVHREGQRKTAETIIEIVGTQELDFGVNEDGSREADDVESCVHITPSTITEELDGSTVKELDIDQDEIEGNQNPITDENVCDQDQEMTLNSVSTAFPQSNISPEIRNTTPLELITQYLHLQDEHLELQSQMKALQARNEEIELANMCLSKYAAFVELQLRIGHDTYRGEADEARMIRWDDRYFNCKAVTRVLEDLQKDFNFEVFSRYYVRNGCAPPSRFWMDGIQDARQGNPILRTRYPDMLHLKASLLAKEIIQVPPGDF